MRNFQNMLCEEFPPPRGTCDCDVCLKMQENSEGAGNTTGTAAGNVSAARDKHKKKGTMTDGEVVRRHSKD